MRHIFQSSDLFLPHAFQTSEKLFDKYAKTWYKVLAGKLVFGFKNSSFLLFLSVIKVPQGCCAVR